MCFGNYHSIYLNTILAGNVTELASSPIGKQIIHFSQYSEQFRPNQIICILCRTSAEQCFKFMNDFFLTLFFGTFSRKGEIAFIVFTQKNINLKHTYNTKKKYIMGIFWHFLMLYYSTDSPFAMFAVTYLPNS